MTTLPAIAALLFVATWLAFRGHGYWAWVILGALAVGWWGAGLPPAVFLTLVVLLFVLVLVFGLPALRRRLVSQSVMRHIGPLLPVLGDTERIALEAGTVW